MSDRSAIEWTDASWNPVTGCTEVSPGCDHCYAKTFAERFRGVAGHPYEQGFDVKLWPERLEVPLRWRRPRRVFVNSMSDLFQDAVPDGFIAKVFATMAMATRHQFQVLTKRPGRMSSWMRRVARSEHGWWTHNGDNPSAYGGTGEVIPGEAWPLPNVWVGTSVEDQHWADIRIPKLLETPAAVRFLSCEPLLGPVDLARWTSIAVVGTTGRHGLLVRYSRCGVHWVIVGGESGHGARPMDPAWARSLRDQCTDAGVPFFFKQWGGRTPRAGGRELDGRTWDEMPAELVDVAV